MTQNPSSGVIDVTWMKESNENAWKQEQLMTLIDKRVSDQSGNVFKY